MPKHLPESHLDTAQICPLCQGANQCAMTLGADISDCWCAKQAFPKLTQLLSGDLAAGLSTGDTTGLSADKLAKLLSQPATACICETCLSRIKRELTVSASEDKNSPSGLVDGLGYEVK